MKEIAIKGIMILAAFVVTLLLFFFAILPLVRAANVLTELGPTVEIAQIDSDFTYTASCLLYGRDGTGVRINFIQLIGGGAGCYVRIKELKSEGATIFYSMDSTLTGCQPIYYHGAKLRPFLDFSASSVAHDTTSVVIQLWPQQ